MKLRSLYILSIVGLLLVIVVQIGGMMYAYDNTKKEAERALNECFRLAFIETVDNEINNLPFPDMTIPFWLTFWGNYTIIVTIREHLFA